MKSEVTRFEKGNAVNWNEFVSHAKNGLFLFDRSYMDYHEDRFTDHSLMIHKEGKLIALFAANEQGNKIYSHAGLTFGGMLYTNELKAHEAVQIMALILAYYRNLGFEELIYKAIPYLFCKYPSQEDLYALFRHHAVLYRRDISSAVDLSQPLRFSETKRQLVDKCQKKGMVVEENNNFSEYWQLLHTVLAKFEVAPVHSLDEIQLLKKRFPDRIRLFEARLGTELQAGVVVYDYGRVVHTQYMANSEQGRKTGALDLINNFLISTIFRDRSYFSFGISTEQDGRELNEGLMQQKEMMGGRGVVHDFYKIALQ